MDYGMCQNCDEFFRGYCFCDGRPDEIISEMIACETYKERPQGEWITVKQDTILGDFEVKNKVCNKCNHATKYEYPFCPWCGADMRNITETPSSCITTNPNSVEAYHQSLKGSAE